MGDPSPLQISKKECEGSAELVSVQSTSQNKFITRVI